MTMKQMMGKYFMGEIDAISLIRMISGMFDPKHAASLLSLICTITRHEQGDIDTETFNEVWNFGIDLKFNRGDYPTEYDDMTLEDLKTELTKMQADFATNDEIKKNFFKDEKETAEERLEILTNETALDHDISLLVSYLAYRDRKQEKKEKEDDCEG